ncbi:MAG: hypothetical protein IPH12_06325 [Saprospirales bacterium]|nr:hypothetical protein [Saprospirales bacterium]
MKTRLFTLLVLFALGNKNFLQAQWQVIDPQFPDSLDLIAWGISVVDENVVWGISGPNSKNSDAEDRYFYKTTDVGQTWTPLPAANTIWGGWLTDVECVPGSGGVYWGVSQTSTVLSKDNGNTWLHEDTPFLLWFAEFLSPNVGWGGGAVHPTPPTSKLLLYKWIGDSLMRAERINATKTRAGPGIEGRADGAPAAGRFWNPRGMAIGPGGNMYVADDFNHCIRKTDPAGNVATLAGAGCLNGYGLDQQPVDGPGDLDYPGWVRGIFLKPSESLLVTAWDNDMVREIRLGALPAFSGVVSNAALSLPCHTIPVSHMLPLTFSGTTPPNLNNLPSNCTT